MVAQNSSSDYLVTFATLQEAAPFQAISPNTPRLITHVGPQAAQVNLQKYLETNQPKFILSSGFAGGLNPTLASGTILFSPSKNFPKILYPKSLYGEQVCTFRHRS